MHFSSLRSVRTKTNGGFALRHGITVVLGLILWAGVIYDTLYPEPEVDPYANYDY